MFSQLPNQQSISNALIRSYKLGRLAHAILFAGSKPEEMEQMAIALAQFLLCKNKANTDSCGSCWDCVHLQDRKHPAITWVYPESKIRVITTEQVHQIIDSARFGTDSGSYDITVINHAERMNVQAANAFLKTLEEPPPGKIFVLTTTTPTKILPTIKSRCRCFVFAGINRPFIQEDVILWLHNFAHSAAISDMGKLGMYSLLAPLIEKLANLRDDIENAFKEKLSTTSNFDSKDKKDVAEEKKIEEELEAGIAAEYRSRRTEIFCAIELWLRDLYLTLIDQFPKTSYFPEIREDTEKIASRITLKQAKENLNSVASTLKILETNVQEALVLEVFLLKLHL